MTDAAASIEDLIARYEGMALERGVPQHTAEALADYVVRGRQHGDFITAVLSNNLQLTFGYADDLNRERLHEIIRFLWNDVPASCWGSPEKVEQWEGLRHPPCEASWD